MLPYHFCTCMTERYDENDDYVCVTVCDMKQKEDIKGQEEKLEKKRKKNL